VPFPQPLRRLLSPILVAVELLVLSLLVVMALVGALLAVFDRRRRLLRVAVLGISYITIELVVLAGFLGVWLVRPLRSRPWYDEANAGLLRWALDRIMSAGRRTVGFEMVVEEPPDSALASDDPVLVLARHGGPGDSYSLVWLLLSRYRRRPRVVLKEALRWEPLLDVALSRMGACFLPRAAPVSGGLAERVGRLAATLRDRDALLLFPEGGNWTADRHRRAIRSLRMRGKLVAARNAALMDHVLPPRPAGVLACLEAQPEIAVVVIAHAGLDDLTSAGMIWNAIPFTSPMTVRWWRTAPPPLSEPAREGWLHTEWAVVDQWIDANRPPG
jgi:1-acyl-sn-glycerol-3-phosphate acyltransferase